MVARSSMASIALLAMLILFVTAATTQVAGAANKPGSSPDLVVEACKNFSQGNLMASKLYFKEETCISVLRSDNRSTVAKDHGDLVLIAFDLLSYRSGEVAAKIDEVLRGHVVTNWTEHAFRYCSADYGFMMKTLPTCRDVFLDAMLLSRGKEPILGYRPGDALDCMDRLGEAAEDCRIWLTDKPDYKQTEEFETVVRHASLAWGLMEIALNYLDPFSKW